MYTVEFFIPLDKDDLLNSYNKSKQYIVEEILSERVVIKRLADCNSKLKNNGVEYILEEFDTLFSASRHFTKLDKDVLQDILDLLILTVKKIISDFSGNFDANHEKSSKRTVLKMIIYLLCTFAEKFENESTVPTTDAIVSGKSKRRKTKKNTNDLFDWEGKKECITQLLYELCQQPLRLVWDPPVVEEDFVNLVSGCCYKFLENPNINQNKTTCENIFLLLGQLVATYNHGLSCSLKIVQLIQQHEHLASTLASALQVFVNKYKVKAIVGDVVREIAQVSEKEFVNDSAGSRTVSSFLIELSQKIPAVISVNLSVLLPLLEQTSYVLRNCALGVITELILQLLSQEDLDGKQRNLRDQLLDHLEDHVHDVNAFVRSRSLQLWLRLLQDNAIPLSRQCKILSIAVERLRDKSNIVRKNTVQLIIALLQNNPFTAKLSTDELQEKYEKELDKLKEMTIGDTEQVNDVSNLENSVADDRSITPEDEMEISPDSIETEKSPVENEAETNEIVNIELAKQQVLVQYLKDTADFTKIISEAIPILIQLLGSRQNSDVLMAIDFFVIAFEFGLKDAIRGVRRMLLLIWSSEASVKDAVTTSYQRLYLNSKTSCSRTKATNIVKNLTALVIGANIGELTSLEELICHLLKSGQLTEDVYQIMWERFALKVPTSKDERRIALMLLAMASGAQLDLVRSNVEILVNTGLNAEHELDFQLAKETCVMLLKLATFHKPSSDVADVPLRFPADHSIFTRVVDVLVKGLSTTENPFWIPFMEKAITLIYTLSDHPDIVCGKLLKQLTNITLDTAGDGNESKSVAMLSRLLSTVGHTALCQLTYLDVAVFTEIKRRQNVQEEEKEKKEKEAKRRNKCKRKSMSALGTLTPAKLGGENLDSAADDELGLAGADADDAEAEYIRKICDTQLVTESNFLSDFGPILTDICSQPTKYPDLDLQMTAVNALAKFMLVSADFCEANLQLFFTLMEKSTQSSIRGNTVVAMGDMAFRFPNLLDPWTSKLYNRLCDSCTHVRLKTLTVLSHLILNDMIKVKGQISEVALCITHDNSAVSDLAKLFFNEFSKKGNAIYNLLPDIISRLSDPKVGTDEENFKKILKFLFSLVQKDRQLEGLVEKLCQRFKTSEGEQQWRELAFCMSLLSYSHKSVQKLLENFVCYGNKLVEPFVLECFRGITNNTKKLSKPETKTLLDELEQKIDETENRGLQENDDVDYQPKMQSVAKRKPTGKRNKRVTKTPAHTQTVTDSPEFVSRPKRTRRQPVPKFDLSDDDDDFE